MYKFKASEMGWDWLIEATGEDMTIKCNREPANEEEWMQLSNWLEETYPLTNEEISHGFSNAHAVYIFPALKKEEESQKALITFPMDTLTTQGYSENEYDMDATESNYMQFITDELHKRGYEVEIDQSLVVSTRILTDEGEEHPDADSIMHIIEQVYVNFDGAVELADYESE